MTDLPELDGVQHRFVDLGDGVTIHVAEAGPPEGPPVMLVHGFPQHWWEWRELIGPLAADGYRVLCPDLRGAGWSSAPAGASRKNDMADDLAAESFTPDGWFKTGDVVRIDAHGCINICDRSKDLVKSGGEWISS
ncbi:MAG: alpha/beta fold hydrolase, partial [Mycobacterium sp.]